MEKKKLLERLEQEDLGTTSARAFERDLRDIETYYGIRVRYSNRHKGYYLDQAADEDLSDFRQFFRLLERSEHLAFLTHSADALSTGKSSRPISSTRRIETKKDGQGWSYIANFQTYIQHKKD